MENIFMTEHGIQRQMTINCEPGISTKTTDPNVPIYWPPILKWLNQPGRHTWLRIDYWEERGAKPHPLLNHYATPYFDLAPLSTDRLISALIVPAVFPVELDSANEPEKGFSLEAQLIQLVIQCKNDPYKPSTCGKLHIFPRSGRFEFVL